VSDLLFSMYLDMLYRTDPVYVYMRRQILHASVMAGMSNHAWQSKGPGKYRIGHRRWQLWENQP